METKYKIGLLACIPLLFVLNSCNNLTEGYSTDPLNITDPSVIDATKFLTGAQVNLIGAYEADINRLTGMWVGYFSGEDRQYIGLSNYSVASRDFNTEWGTIYSGVLYNVKIIKQKARVERNPRILGIVQVMEAMAIGLAADLWGDVPYKEALQYPAISTPKYDPQMEIYAAVQVLLDSAIMNLNENIVGAQDPGSADIFFAGNHENWIKAANTLKARFYLHTKDYANAITYSLAGIDDPGANMMAPHGSTYLQDFNLFYSFTTYDRPGYMGANSIAPRLLDEASGQSRNNAKTNEEARLWYYYLVGGGGNFNAIEYEPNVIVDFDWGNPTTANGFFGASTSFPMVTLQENLLIRSEAYSKLNNFNDALFALNELRGLYNAGLFLNIGYIPGNTDFTDYWFGESDELGLLYDLYEEGDFAPGGIANTNNETRETALLREILEERYITFIGQLESFNDVRRTKNFLNLPVVAGSPSIPKRLLYPQSEVNTNAANIPPGAGLFTDTPANASDY